MHRGLDAASSVMAAPSSPDCATDPLRCVQDFISRGGPWGVGLPRLGVFTGRDDRGGPSGGDGVMAFAGVEGAVGGDGCDLLFGRALVEQRGQHRSIAHVAGRELGCTDFQGFLFDPNMDLAPDASF